MMKRAKLDSLFSLNRRRSFQIFMFIGFLYILLVGFEVPFLLKNGFGSDVHESFSNNGSWFMNFKPFVLESGEYLDEKDAPIRPLDIPYQSRPERRINEFAKSPLSSLNFSAGIMNLSPENSISKSAKEALQLGRMLWQELEFLEKNSSGSEFSGINNKNDGKIEECPHSLTTSGDIISRNGRVMVLPCGLTLGSHITVVGRPRVAHAETNPKISLLKEGQYVMVSQFMIELQGLKAVDGEDPPRILHFNPRLKGDWSGKPVIEQNTCYRMQWGDCTAVRGSRSRADEETVDNLVKCENWIRDDVNGSGESNSKLGLNRFIGQTKKVDIDWPFPFIEDKLFVLTLSAGLEGFHVNVDGRHVTSFPYRTGFTLEEATGLSLDGDIDVLYVFVASLPTSNLNFPSQTHLDISEKWKAPPIMNEPVELFIGILSAGNHFAERMAARKSWMQDRLIKSSKAVARFFVALHKRKEVNVELKKEAEFFRDIVIVPYVDNYDLVVLKTVAICEYGVRTVSAKYIMKGDDDTFVRVDAVIKEAKKVSANKSSYIGNINFYHKPLRSGKWAVTYTFFYMDIFGTIFSKIVPRHWVMKRWIVTCFITWAPLHHSTKSCYEWLEEVYPPYANGPGYIISSDIANFILSDFEKHRLRFFKMEDVSMGMWVEKFNSSRPVEYKHSLKFCQFGCIEDYYTAHYQSPKQMICMWNKLQQQGKPLCCNIR